MRKGLAVLLFAFLLTGCGVQETFETIGDVYAPVELPAAQVVFTVPEDASVQTIQGENGKLYLCENYVLTVQTLTGGDLNRTLMDTTGYEKEKLNLVETNRNGVKRYDCVWTCAGEGGDQVGRAVILEDSGYISRLAFVVDDIFSKLGLSGKSIYTLQAG